MPQPTNWQLSSQSDLEFPSGWGKGYDFSHEFNKLLWLRGYRSEADLSKLFSDDASEVYTYYKDLPGAEVVAGKILAAVDRGDKIIIYGDYDVDGITSTSLLWRFLYRKLKADVVPFIPNREREGYGLNKAAIQQLMSEQVGEDRQATLVTVDCGIRDIELIAELKAQHKNLQILVTDHHQLPDTASGYTADAIAHPMLAGSKVEPQEICACAVTWAVVCAMEDIKHIAHEPSGLELVALATVCDIMPLIGLNRKIVKVGLQELASSKLPGVRALSTTAGISSDQELSTYHLGFVLGPRINAAGRIAEPIQAVRLLCTDSDVKAAELAQSLETINKERQDLMNSALDELTKLNVGERKRLIFVKNPDWKEGIIGLVAGKLNEKYGLPAIAVTQGEDGNWVGSARSIKELNITELLGQHAELLLRYGGHAEAAGFSVSTENLRAVQTGLETGAAEKFGGLDLQRPVNYDLELDLGEMNLRLFDELELLKPFGNGNAQPKFFLPGLKFAAQRVFGREGSHISFNLAYSGQTKLEAIWFNHEYTGKGTEGSHDIIGTLGYNEWKGRKYHQINIRHYRPGSKS